MWLRRTATDGRTAYRADDASTSPFTQYANVSAMLLDLTGNGLNVLEEAELAVLRLGAQPLTDFYCEEP